MTLDGTRTSLVSTVFERLNCQNLPYAVLRNYDGLPDHVGADIDMLSYARHSRAISTVLCDVAREHGWWIVYRRKRYGFDSIIFAHPRQDGFIKWDVWAPINWKGFTWISTDFALENRHLHERGFYIPSPGVESAILLLKELLHTGLLRRRYLDRASVLAKRDPQGFGGALYKCLGEALTDELLRLAIASQWSDIERACWRIRLQLVFSSFLLHPLATAKRVGEFLLGHLRERARADTGFLLCLLGPDGSGKTTIAGLLPRTLERYFDETHYYHGRYGILPDMKSFVPTLVKRAHQLHRTPEVHRFPITGRLRTCVYMTYYAVDYLLGYLINFHIHSRQLVIFDRYFYDYVIQPTAITANSVLFQALMRVVPRPNLIVHLSASPGTVYERKPELSIEEIAQQQVRIRQLAEVAPDIIQVDAENDAWATVNHIRELVLDRMHVRAQRVSEV